MVAIFTAIGIWLFLAQFIFVAWAFRPERYYFEPRWAIKESRLKTWAIYFVGISAFIGIVLTLRAGYEFSLGFLPRSWGSYDEYGDWTSAASTIATILSIIGAYAIVHFLSQHNKKRREQFIKEHEDWLEGRIYRSNKSGQQKGAQE